VNMAGAGSLHDTAVPAVVPRNVPARCGKSAAGHRGEALLIELDQLVRAYRDNPDLRIGELR
jgi:hypothetical protein